MRQIYAQKQDMTMRGLMLAAVITGLSCLPALANEKEPKPAEAAETVETVEKTETPAVQEEVEETEKVPDYLDNRSNPETLIESYYNAINRKEYVRAYSYYSEEGRDPHFDDFAKGYENTKSVRVKTRHIEPDPGAGQIYWSLPLAIEAEDNDGKKTVFTGCYTLRMTNPAMQEEPPFKPLEIMTGSLTPSPLDLEKSVPESCDAP